MAVKVGKKAAGAAADVTDAEIAAAFAGTDFGTSDHRKLLARSVLKVALRYHCGWTVTEIMKRLGLTTPKGRVTERGRAFCYQELDCAKSG